MATEALPLQHIFAGDAVMAFASLLTTLPHVVPFGATAWATPGVELATAFNEANGLEVSGDFPDGWVFPKIEGTLLATVTSAAQPEKAQEQMTPEDATCPILARAPAEYTCWEKRVWRRGVLSVARPTTMPMARDLALNLARQSAFAHRHQHDYLPQSADATDNWQPHAWVVLAIQAAAVGTPAAPGIDLSDEHKGMRVDYHGLLRQVHGGLAGEPGLAEMVRQLHSHMTELGRRWYAGDRRVVDELLQLYCIEPDARRALIDASPKGGSEARDAVVVGLIAAAQAAWTCIGELSPTQARVEVAQMLAAAIDAAKPTQAGDAEPRFCRACGCTDTRACRGGCWWVEADLCSACAPQAGGAHG